MKREDLAEEIRGAGMLLRYADGPVLWGQSKSRKSTAKQNTQRKLKESDWTVIRRASTCFTCKKRASDGDIKEAEEMALNYRSFARLIWLAIPHCETCDADPYLPVSEVARKHVAKARKKLTTKARKKASDAKNKKPGRDKK